MCDVGYYVKAPLREVEARGLALSVELTVYLVWQDVELPWTPFFKVI